MKRKKHLVFFFVLSLCWSLGFSWVIVQLTLPVDASFVSEELRPCLPASRPYSFELLGKEQVGPVTFSLFQVLDKREPDYPWETLVVSMADQKCGNLIPARIEPPSLTRFMPIESANRLALSRYQVLLKMPDGRKLLDRQLGLSIPVTPVGAPIDLDMDEYTLNPEDAWALRQLGIAIPSAVKVLPAERTMFDEKNPLRVIYPTVDPMIFADILPVLKQTSVPVKVPAYIPNRGEGVPVSSTVDQAVYANLGSISKDNYSVVLGYTKDCKTSPACLFGGFGAVKIAPSFPTLAQQLKDTGESYKTLRSRGERYASRYEPGTIRLANGTTGYFTPWMCGSSCLPAQISWDQNGYRYGVSLKYGDRDALVEMANSMITGK